MINKDFKDEDIGMKTFKIDSMDEKYYFAKNMSLRYQQLHSSIKFNLKLIINHNFKYIKI